MAAARASAVHEGRSNPARLPRMESRSLASRRAAQAASRDGMWEVCGAIAASPLSVSVGGGEGLGILKAIERTADGRSSAGSGGKVSGLGCAGTTGFDGARMTAGGGFHYGQQDNAAVVSGGAGRGGGL